MDASTISTNEKVRLGRPLSHPHPLPVALHAAGLTVAELAAKLRRPVSTVKCWYKRPNDPQLRPIPRAIAERLKKEFKVPLSAWARIAE